MSNYIFSKLIKCENCGKNYRGKKYRDKSVYACSGKLNYGVDFCPTSEKIDEEDLIFLIRDNDIHNIKQILVDKNNNIKVIMNDGHELFWDKSRIIR